MPLNGNAVLSRDAPFREWPRDDRAVSERHLNAISGAVVQRTLKRIGTIAAFGVGGVAIALSMMFASGAIILFGMH